MDRYNSAYIYGIIMNIIINTEFLFILVRKQKRRVLQQKR